MCAPTGGEMAIGVTFDGGGAGSLGLPDRGAGGVGTGVRA